MRALYLEIFRSTINTFICILIFGAGLELESNYLQIIAILMWLSKMIASTERRTTWNATQKKPEGIAQALIISEEWVDKNKTILMLGDNLFFGPNLNNVIRNSIDLNDGATIFGYRLQIRNVLEYFNLMKIIMFFPLKKNQKILNQIGRLLVYIYMMIRLGHMQEN